MHRRLAVQGQVQGVGFRPWVWQQATSLGVVGWVRNTGSGVEIDLHGEPGGLDALQARLWQAPLPARVEQVEVISTGAGDEAAAAAPASPRAAEGTAGSDAALPRGTVIGTDLGPCGRCLADVFTPGNRRWRYPFATCPQCGPRYTITRNLPYSRAHTSMSRFAMCQACEDEFNDPQDRRFHHQLNACPACGPQLWLRRVDGSLDTHAPMAGALRILREGGLLAIKGMGGFHLCGDARQPAVLQRLRRHKHHETQPLATIMANLASVAPWAELGEAERRWLQAPERPIVLLRQTARARAELAGVAPGLAYLGVMLPTTPIHDLLFHEAMGPHAGVDAREAPNECVLVMTSAHAAGAPRVLDNDTALLELAGMADAWLMHDRDVLARNDDSVLRVRADGTACFVRRGRGHAPAPIAMPAPDAMGSGALPSILALGGPHEATLCIAQGERALVSPYIGNLDAVETRLGYARLADLWPGWVNTQPDALACDLHPDHFSSILAAHLSHTRASASSGIDPLPVVQVQHHHAHVAAVLAEHAEAKEAHRPVLGLVLDTPGLGMDGTSWGGELLRVDGGQSVRLGHLVPMPLPGGDDAAREPWRLAAAVLGQFGLQDEIEPRFGRHPQCRALANWLEKPHPHMAQTTSLCRLLDAAAGMLDVLSPRLAVDQPDEARLRLESLALQHDDGHGPAAPLPDGCPVQADLTLDWRPLLRWLAAQTRPHPGPSSEAVQARLAAVFHATLVDGLANWVMQASEQHGLRTVVLCGQALSNAVLDEHLWTRLQGRGLKVWRPTQFPCGDGALSLGQAWVARHRLNAGRQAH
ncbi:MAG: carbamoyltransferase HypF [Aquabacterium sp.]